MPARGDITADASLAQARKTSPAFKALLEHPHGHHQVSIREDTYKGHHIVIKTIYEIEIDGQPFRGTLDVSNTGTVQYHGIPNVSSASAVELIRSVIDTFPGDFAPKSTHDHSTHRHGRRAKRSKPRRKEVAHARSRKRPR